MRKKLRVLFYTPIFYPNILGGAIVAYKLVTELSRTINIRVITYNVDLGRKFIVNKFKKEQEFKNLKITRLRPSVLNIFGSSNFFSFEMLYHFFKEALNSDIIHIFGSYHHLSLFFLSLMAKFTGKPILFSPLSIHEDLEFSKDKKIFFLVKLLYLSLRNARMIVFTKADIKCLKKFGLKPKKINIIPPGFDPVLVKNEKKDKNIILSVGRFDWNKGQDILLLAMKKVVKKAPNVKLIIAGKITNKRCYDKVLHLRDKLGLRKNVKVVPDITRDKLIKLYEKASVFIFPSTADSYGLVNLEAMSVGLPVIASNVGGVSEIVKHGKTGFLVPSGDYDKFADLIIKLLEDKKLRRLTSKNAIKYAIKYVKKFTWKNYAKKTMKVYNDMLYNDMLYTKL